MSKKQSLTLDTHCGNVEGGINRREMVRRLMLAGGAGIALPGIAEDRPATIGPANPKQAAENEARSATTNRAPKFLDSHQNDTLIVLAEGIIPGSSRAQVSQFIDLLLAVDTQDAQKKFLASLSAFEAESIRRYSHPYEALTETQQNEILTSAATAKRGHSGEEESQQLTMRDHFENMKEWVAGAYYSSEIGMKELGWTGQVFFTSFPGCQQSGPQH